MASLTQLEIGGPPRERGRAAGEGLRELIVARDRRWREAIEAGTGARADDFIARFLRETDFLPEIERQTPDLLEEVRGLAEGSRLTFEAILAAQLMDEEWWFTERVMGRRHHCSSLGSHHASARRTTLAQTMDLIAWNEGFQVALTIRDIAPGADGVVLTMAGMIGLNGMTSLGLGVVVNTLADLASDARGLPVAFVSRGLLRQRTHDDAVGFLRRVRHASGQNYIVGDRHRVSDHECSRAGAFPYRPAGAGEGLVWHTNHPLASVDLSKGRTAELAAASEENTRRRMAVLDRHLANRSEPLTAPDAQALLSNREDGRHPIARRLGEMDQPAYTFATTIYELGSRPAAHIAPGPACSTPFVTIPLGRSLAAAAE